MEPAANSVSRADRYPCPTIGHGTARYGFRSFHDFALSSHMNGKISDLPTLHPIHVSFKAFLPSQPLFSPRGRLYPPNVSKEGLAWRLKVR
ncbi:hypothetical protein WCP94_003043 [Bilophila wadsworthia]